MSRKHYGECCNKKGDFLGTFVYIVNPGHVKFDPAAGISITEAIEVMVDLANRFNTEVRTSFNDVKLTIHANPDTQDFVDTYFKLLRSRQLLRARQRS